MNVTIPKQLQKRVEEHRKHLGISAREYISRALQGALQVETEFLSEFRAWRNKTRKASTSFWEKHNL